MNASRRTYWTMAGTFAVAMIGMQATALAKPPCPVDAKGAPVKYYTQTWCYPGLNTYKAPNQQQIKPKRKVKQISPVNKVVVPRSALKKTANQ